MPRTAHAAKVRKSPSCASPPQPSVQDRGGDATELAALLGCSIEEATARAVRWLALYLRHSKLT